MSMHWFPFYFSDYASKTEHLSLAENGAYLLLLSTYYKTGNPLPANAQQLHRICRAFDDAEREAIDTILNQFFTLDGDVYRHSRADEELEKSSKISEKRSKAAKTRHSKSNASAMQVHNKCKSVADTTTTTTTLTPTKTTTETKEDKQLVPQAAPVDVQTIFDHWKTILNHPRSNLDTKRITLIKKALAMGYPVSDLILAITGCSLTPHNIGQNDRGTRYDSLNVIFKDGDNIDRFMANGLSPPVMPSKSKTIEEIRDNLRGGSTYEHVE